MDSSAPSLDFAVIGHQDSWANVSSFVNRIRTADQGNLSSDKIRDIFPYIPPRELFRVRVISKTKSEINGVYIETFIDPDKLGVQYLRTNIKKVEKAIEKAKKLGAKIVALGGFTSIVLEGELDNYATPETKFTTGNSLTAAYIARGIERAALEKRVELEQSNILIVGATGDIGLALVGYFKSICSNILLNARNINRLKSLSDQLTSEGVSNKFSNNLIELLPQADLVICVASSSGLDFSTCKKQVIICDAGYPKNLDKKIEGKVDLIFHGGMGRVTEGYEFIPDYTDSFYQYPAPFIIHGCILEAMVLAFENKFQNYSVGKGNITVDKIEEIYESGVKHGIILAPFYNSSGLC